MTIRKSHTRFSASKVIRVRAVPSPDVGAAGRSKKVIGHLKAGMLTTYGYHPVESMTSRHRALSKAITRGREKPLAVFRRLHAISRLTKGKLPTASRTYQKDRNWVRSKFMSKSA